MNSNLILILGTALLSSLLTVVLGLIIFKLFLLNRLKRELDEFIVTARAELKTEILETADEILPRFRTEVSEGFKEALASATGADLLEKTARSAMQTSAGIMENSLKFFLGRQKAESRNETPDEGEGQPS